MWDSTHDSGWGQLAKRIQKEKVCFFLRNKVQCLEHDPKYKALKILWFSICACVRVYVCMCVCLFMCVYTVVCKEARDQSQVLFSAADTLFLKIESLIGTSSSPSRLQHVPGITCWGYKHAPSCRATSQLGFGALS